MIKDWSVESLNGEVFHFKNSLRPFIEIMDDQWEVYFLELNEQRFYTIDDLSYEELEFYTKDDDPTFKGVKVCGNFKWTVSSPPSIYPNEKSQKFLKSIDK